MIDDIHVMPATEHETSINCWCRPVLDYKDVVTGVEVWVHHTKDEVLQ